MAGARGQLGVLRLVAYWRAWDVVDFDLGGGHQGVAVLECGHVSRVRASRHNGYRRASRRTQMDTQGRPVRCFCIECRVARECV